MSVTLNQLRDVLDDLNLRSSINKNKGEIDVAKHIEDGVIFFYFFVLEEQELIDAQAILAEKDISDTNNFYEAYRFCSNWNASYYSPKLYVDEDLKAIIAQWTWDTEVCYSAELLENIIISPFVNHCTKAFEDALQNNLYTN